MTEFTDVLYALYVLTRARCAASSTISIFANPLMPLPVRDQGKNRHGSTP